MTGPLRLVVATACLLIVAACGASDKPVPGPDVRGLALPDAKSQLATAGITATVHATDALFGVLVESNFTVCKEHYVSAHLVRLDVAKHGC